MAAKKTQADQLRTEIENSSAAVLKGDAASFEPLVAAPAGGDSPVPGRRAVEELRRQCLWIRAHR